MMRHQVLFIQGGGKGVHDGWDNKLVASLERALGPDYEIRYPSMPDEADPSYKSWRAALEHELASLRDGAMLVAHSIGGTIAINAIAERTPRSKLRGVFLIAAPFVGEGGWPSEELKSKPDLGARLPPDVPIYLYHGSDDETAPVEHVGLYARVIPQAVIRKLAGRDHQLNDDLSEVAADVRGVTNGWNARPTR